MDEPPIFPEALQTFSVVEDGHVLLHMGLIMTLYIDEAHAPEKKEGLIKCFDDYWSLCGTELHQASLPQVTNQWIDLDQEKLPPARKWVNSLSENHAWSMTCTGSKRTTDASAFNFEILCNGAWENSLSYVTATLPFIWFSNHEGRLPALVRQWCEWTSAYHGYAGIGFISSLESNPAKRAEPLIYELARRFPGLEVDNPVSHATYLKDGIKGVNWLTVLGDKWIEKIDGMDHLKSQLTNDFEFLSYPTGVVIKAGSHPKFGDGRTDSPQQYRIISRLLNPIKTDYPVALQHIHPQKPTFDRIRTKEWFSRFD